MRRTRPADTAIDTTSRSILRGRALLRKAGVRILIAASSSSLAVSPKLSGAGSAEPRQPRDDRIPGERSSRRAGSRRCLWRHLDRVDSARSAPKRAIIVAPFPSVSKRHAVGPDFCIRHPVDLVGASPLRRTRARRRPGGGASLRDMRKRGPQWPGCRSATGGSARGAGGGADDRVLPCTERSSLVKARPALAIGRYRKSDGAAGDRRLTTALAPALAAGWNHS
jgi:hypothetical protein